MWVYTEACGAPALRTGGLRRMERDTDKGQHVQRSVGKGSGGAIAQPQERAGGGGGGGGGAFGGAHSPRHIRKTLKQGKRSIDSGSHISGPPIPTPRGPEPTPPPSPPPIGPESPSPPEGNICGG